MHYCPGGCHHSRQQVLDDMVRHVGNLFIDHPPAVPVWNKWSKLVPPLGWFALFSSLCGLLAAVVGGVAAMFDNDSAVAVHEDDVVGLDTQRQYMQQQLVRFRKTHRFLNSPSTPDKLMSCFLTLLPVEKQIMSKLFKVSSRF